MGEFPDSPCRTCSSGVAHLLGHPIVQTPRGSMQTSRCRGQGKCFWALPHWQHLGVSVCDSQSPSGCVLQSSFRFAIYRELVLISSMDPRPYHKGRGPVWQLSVSWAVAQCPKRIGSHMSWKDECKVLLSGGGGSQWDGWGAGKGNGVGRWYGMGRWHSPGVRLPRGHTLRRLPQAKLPLASRHPASSLFLCQVVPLLPVCQSAGLPVLCAHFSCLCCVPAKVSGLCWHMMRGVVGQSILGKYNIQTQNRSACSHLGLWAQAWGWSPHRAPCLSLSSTSLPPPVSLTYPLIYFKSSLDYLWYLIRYKCYVNSYNDKKGNLCVFSTDTTIVGLTRFFF